MKASSARAEHPRTVDVDAVRNRLRGWRVKSRELARTWAARLGGGSPSPREALQSALRREMEAYSWELLRLRLQEQGLVGVDLWSKAWAAPAIHDSRGSRSGAWLHVNQPSPDPDVDQANAMMRASAGEDHGVGPPRPTVTREDFERFCRWTGMDPGCQAGSEAHRASLVFYLVVFTLLTDGGATPDLAGTRLLERLRRCHEALVAHVTDLLREASAPVADPPTLPPARVLTFSGG